MRRVAHITKNWVKLAKQETSYGQTLYELYESGRMSRATVWSFLFSGIKARRSHKTVSPSVLESYHRTKGDYKHMTNEELQERDRLWERVYGKDRKVVTEEEQIEELGTLKQQQEEEEIEKW